MPTLAYRGVLADRLELPEASGAAVADVADRMDRALADGALAVLVKTSRLLVPLDVRYQLARDVVDAFAARVGARFGLPVATEPDRPQRCDLAHGATRTLLPHHDGGHCSFLTPPAGPDRPVARSLANERYTTTDAHKVYQGLFLREAGAGLSLTSYLDLVRLLVAAWRHQRGRRPGLDELLRWYGDNVAAALERAGGAGYLPIGAQLGADGPARDVAVHHLEALHPVGGALVRAADLAEDLARSALGVSFDQMMRDHAVLAPAETGDLLVGHNLFAWHGGIEGGAGREIDPICVTSAPTGAAYEGWLVHHWLRFFARAT